MKKRTMIITAAVMATGIAALSGTAIVTNAASADGAGHVVARAVSDVRIHAKLNQAERDGTITSTQKAAFLSEEKTLHSEFKSTITKSSTKQERATERAKLKAEIKSWASSTGFPLAKVFPKLAA